MPHVPLWVAVGDLVVPMLVLAVATYGLRRIRRMEYVIDCARGRHDLGDVVRSPEPFRGLDALVEKRKCKRCGAWVSAMWFDAPIPPWRPRPPAPLDPHLEQVEHRN